MKLHNINRPNMKKDKKRLGKGQGSGQGKQAGKGHKGQKSRSGGNIPVWFEGGQMPLQRRLPKKGFRSRSKKIIQLVNLADLVGIEAEVIDREFLASKGLVRKTRKNQVSQLKILAKIDDNFENKVHIKANAFSKSAKEIIEKNGGKAEVV
ncbi:MAG: 50S ribosomal protein L15 [Candidatus Cloacimonadota bacterium]|nr:50S ribosomal protein L15 [Candidatus Cloacimonadota bacterium]